LCEGVIGLAYATGSVLPKLLTTAVEIVKISRVQGDFMPQLILTAVGNDRPGLVGELTGHLLTAGANILDTRMVNLRGRFAVLVLLEASDLEAIQRNLPAAAERMGLMVHMNAHDAGSGGASKAAGLPFRLKTYSLDQPGLVHRVTEVLRSHGVNIEDLTARQESAAFAGEALFIMDLKLTVPATVAIRKLRADLEAACDKVNADLDLEQA
jgi:glycine cleavage system transcriptional repressor